MVNPLCSPYSQLWNIKHVNVILQLLEWFEKVRVDAEHLCMNNNLKKVDENFTSAHDNYSGAVFNTEYTT